MQLYTNRTMKPLPQFVADLEQRARQQDFVIHNKGAMDMARSFALHNVPVREDFDIHMLQFCKPAKAAQVMSANPERAALMPKFVIAFSQDNHTQVRFLHYDAQTVTQLLGDDRFSAIITGASAEIIATIEESL